MAYTDIDKPDEHFNTAPYSGDSNTTQAITGVGFQPDWVWIKGRSSAANHNLWDIIRGTTKYIKTNSVDAEITDATLFNSFNSDGFTVGNGGIVNDSGQTYVGWCWKGANGTASNTDGSITSTVSANTTSGFSIVSYTGTGTTDTSATIGHGLGTAPNFIIIKGRNNTAGWIVGCTALGWNNRLRLEGTQASLSDSYAFGPPPGVTPSSSTFTVAGGSGDNHTNLPGGTYVAYCFAEKKGFSKFGSYTGNGNANGTYVYTGFKPAWVLIKNYTAAGYNWALHDNKRNEFNLTNRKLQPNTNAAEVTTSDVMDFYSNGFKARTSDPGINASGTGYIYMAFAENPFVTSTGIPACAR